MKKLQILPARFGWLAALAAAVLPVHAATITFTATEDNTILNDGLANNNYGSINPISSGTVLTHTQRSILRFDVNPLFPASGLAIGSLNGLNPKSKFLALSHGRGIGRAAQGRVTARRSPAGNPQRLTNQVAASTPIHPR